MIKSRCVSILQDSVSKSGIREFNTPAALSESHSSLGGNSGPGSPLITLHKWDTLIWYTRYDIIIYKTIPTLILI